MTSRRRKTSVDYILHTGFGDEALGYFFVTLVLSGVNMLHSLSLGNVVLILIAHFSL